MLYSNKVISTKIVTGKTVSGVAQCGLSCYEQSCAYFSLCNQFTCIQNADTSIDPNSKIPVKDMANCVTYISNLNIESVY